MNTSSFLDTTCMGITNVFAILTSVFRFELIDLRLSQAFFGFDSHGDCALRFCFCSILCLEHAFSFSASPLHSHSHSARHHPLTETFRTVQLTEHAQGQIGLVFALAAPQLTEHALQLICSSISPNVIFSSWGNSLSIPLRYFDGGLVKNAILLLYLFPLG